MAITNKILLARIETLGVDEALNGLEPEQVEHDIVKIIVRTIKDSKAILVSSLEEFVAGETPTEDQLKETKTI